MAVTKIKAIRSTVDSAIAYITNTAKMDEKLLISSYGYLSDLMVARGFEWMWKTAKQYGL